MVAAVTYRNDIPPQCELTQYDLLIKEISDFVHDQYSKTGRKVIVLADFNPGEITIFIPSNGKPDAAVISHMRTLLMDHLRIGPNQSKACYDQQQFAMAENDMPQKNMPMMALIRIEMHYNNTGIQILYWIALVFNLGMLGYLAAFLRRKSA